MNTTRTTGQFFFSLFPATLKNQNSGGDKKNFRFPTKSLRKRLLSFQQFQQRPKQLKKKELNKKRCWKVCWNCWNLLESGFQFPTSSNSSNSQKGVKILITNCVGMLESETAISAGFSRFSIFFSNQGPGSYDPRP